MTHPKFFPCSKCGAKRRQPCTKWVGGRFIFMTTYHAARRKAADSEPSEPMSEASCVACGAALTTREHAIGDGQCTRCFEGAENECRGHPAGPFDAMGETVYCDGSCNR